MRSGPHGGLKIALFGVFGAGNLGNECTLEALLYNLRRLVRAAQISLICSGAREAAATYDVAACPIRPLSLPPISNMAIRFLRRIVLGIPLELYRYIDAIKRLREVDVLIMTGTGMLGDFGIRPFDLHYDILRWSIAARLSRCKLLFVSVGVGPIRNRASRMFVKAALTLADYRSYRDHFSKEYLEWIGFRTPRDRVRPDLAFSLPAALIPAARRRNGDRAIVGVGLMTYYNRRSIAGGDQAVYRGYLTSVAMLVHRLLERNYTVRLLIGDARYDQRVRLDVKELLREGDGDQTGGTLIDEPASTFNEVLSQLAQSDIVVASRYHNVLLALMVNRLVVALSYHEKVEALMCDVGLKEFCHDIEHIDIDRVLEQIAHLETKAETLKAQVASKTEAYRGALREQYDQIFAMWRDAPETDLDAALEAGHERHGFGAPQRDPGAV